MALEISGCRQQSQRPARRLLRFFRIGLPVRHRRQALRGERLRIELQLAGWGAEFLPTLRSDRDRAGIRQVVGIHLRGASGGAVEQSAQQFRFRHAEYRVVDAHPLCEFLGHAQV